MKKTLIIIFIICVKFISAQTNDFEMDSILKSNELYIIELYTKNDSMIEPIKSSIFYNKTKTKGIIINESDFGFVIDTLFVNGKNYRLLSPKIKLTTYYDSLISIDNDTSKHKKIRLANRSFIDPSTGVELRKGRIVFENDGLHYLGGFKDLGNGNISFKVQSWGYADGMEINTTVEEFKKTYYGATWGKK